MTRVDKISEVRHLRFLQGLTISEIIRRTKLARNTIRKIIRSNQTEFTYHRETTPQPQTGPFREIIKSWLKEDSEKKRKQRRTATRIYAILRDEYGYAGSYESIAKYVQEIRQELNLDSKEAYIPLIYGPAEAFQFDWGEVLVYIAKQLVKVYIGVVVLCHSRHFYVRAYPCQKQELMLDVQQRAFSFFGGVCRRGIYDNLRTAVKQLLKGHHPKLQKRFVQFSSYYLYEPQFCNPASGNEKGRVEHKVGYIERNFFNPTPHFESMDELNERLLTFCISKTRMTKHPDMPEKSCWEVYEAEKDCFVQLPSYEFECCRLAHAVVSSTSKVHFENNWYSVPDEYNNKVVQVKGYADEVVISNKGKEIARHPRNYGKGKHEYIPYHYLGVLARKPRAITDGAPFKDWKLPEVFDEYRRLLNRKYKDGDIYFAKTLVLLRDWPIKEVTEAVSKAVAAKVLGDSYILSLLRQKEAAGQEEATIDIKGDLTKYKAMQSPLSAYNNILKNKEDIIQ